MKAPKERARKGIRLAPVDPDERAFEEAAQARLLAKRAALEASSPVGLSPLPEPVLPEPVVARDGGFVVAEADTLVRTFKRTERTERTSSPSSTSSPSRREEVEGALAVLEDMAASEIPAWQVPFRVARRLRAFGRAKDEAVLLEVAAAIVERLETCALECDAMAWNGEPVMLGAAISQDWSRVRSCESRLAIAAAEAMAEATPAVLAQASAGLCQCFRVLARLQRLLGDEDVHPGQRQLAAILGCTQRTVSGYLRTLEYVGLLVVRNDSFAPGRRAKSYRVTASLRPRAS